MPSFLKSKFQKLKIISYLTKKQRLIDRKRGWINHKRKKNLLKFKTKTRDNWHMLEEKSS